MRNDNNELDGFTIVGPEEIQESIFNLLDHEEQYLRLRDFFATYEVLKTEEPDLQFTAEEQEVNKKYFEDHKLIAEFMNAGKDIDVKMVYTELNHRVKGHDNEKKQLASMMCRHYLVGQNLGFPSANCVIDDMIQDQRIDKMSDVIKHTLIKMLV